MRYDARLDLALAAAVGLATGPLFATAAMAGGAQVPAAWCGDRPVRDGQPPPSGDMAGCHACLFAKREGEDEERG